MAQVMPSMANISWERLEREDAVTYPCPAPDEPGSAIVFGDGFPREGGRGLFVPADVTDPAELPDEAFPLVLTTGRQLEHWHTGAMTRRASVLDAIEPGPSASLHPDTLAQLGIAPGETIRVETRRGTISPPRPRRYRASVPDGVHPLRLCGGGGQHPDEPGLDPYGKIPEFKFCAARVGGRRRGWMRRSEGAGQLLCDWVIVLAC